MDQRSQYLIQILEKIGAPLLAAVADVSARQGGTADQQAGHDAQRVAELLARSVQMTISLGQSMDLASMPDQGESLRLALAALAGEVVAGQYKSLGRVPTEQDAEKSLTALRAVLTFSENFMPTPENVARLADLKAQGQSVDSQQTFVQSVQAFLPVVNAIGSFPFGQPEQKLIQDVSERLLSLMYEMTQRVFGNSLNEMTRPYAELGILRALALIYAESHMGELTRLMSLPEELRMQQPLSLDPVWAGFDRRVAMLEVLSLSLAAGNTAGQAGGSSKAPSFAAPPPVAPPIPAAPVAPPVQAAPPAAANPLSMFAKPDAATPPPAAPVTPPAAPPASANPMSMFAKPGAATPPAAPPAPPPIPPAPPAAPPAQETPPATPPSSPPASGPMSFFKKSE